MTRREAEWDEDERANVLAYLDYESQLCRCGGYLPETTDPANQDRYRTELPKRCHRCDAVQMRQAQFADAPRTQALTVWPVWLPG